MPIALRRSDDTVAPLAPLDGITYHRLTDPHPMALAQQRPVDVMRARLEDGHRPYVAMCAGEIVAWGWVATVRAELGELAFRFELPAGDRYLWNFVTAPNARGLGIYPRLLQAIVEMESAEASRFWIVRAPENHASGSGIERAGFRRVATLSVDLDGRAAVGGDDETSTAAAARLLGLPVARGVLAHCWRCVRRALEGGRPCAEGACHCDYQRPERGCAA